MRQVVRPDRPTRGSSPLAPAPAAQLPAVIGNRATGALLRKEVGPFAKDRDAKYRDRMDEWRRYRLKELEKSKQPAPEESEEPETEEEVEKLIDAGGAELQKVLDLYKIPDFERTDPVKTKEQELVADVRSRLASVHEYMDYFARGIEYVHLTGLPLDMVPYLEQVSELTNGVLGKVDKIEDTLGQLDDAIEAIESVREFAHEMKGPMTIENVDKWIDAAGRLNNAAKPYIDSYTSAAHAAALSGEAAAGAAVRMSLVLAVVTLEVQAGLGMLKAGSRYIKKHQERLRINTDEEAYDEDQRRKREEAEAAERAKVPEPSPPQPWRSHAQRRQSAKAWREEELRYRFKQRQHENRLWAIRFFYDVEWKRRYKARRGELKAAIRRAFGAGKDTNVDERADEGNRKVARAWLSILQEGTPAEQIGRFDDLRKHGKGHVDIRPVEGEFVPPPCPYYEKMRDEELMRFLAKVKLSY